MLLNSSKNKKSELNVENINITDQSYKPLNSYSRALNKNNPACDPK